jgi:hypothetical protein
MITAMRKFPTKLAGCMGALAIGATFTARAAVPGAWEEFPTLANAKAWLVYDFSDEMFYYPVWEHSVVGQEYISLNHAGDEPLTFSADLKAGNGALTGSYSNVDEISCDVFIENLTTFDALECSIFGNGPNGRTFYYSRPRLYSDFVGNGWWTVYFPFDEQWFYWDGSKDVGFLPDATFLSAVEEVGITFYPRLGYPANNKAAIDNFVLEPKVVAPKLTTATTATDFQISFLKAAGVSYTLEKMTTVAPFTWSVVTGQSGITGSGTQLFSTPMDESKKIFRVKAASFYTSVVTPP